MIKYSREFFKKSFTSDTMKSAYMMAVKWYSTNVLSKAEFVNVHVQFVKELDKDELPTITVHLFAVIDGEKEVMNQFCECCKEVHKSFYMNEDMGCNSCSAISFQKRVEEKSRIKKDYYRDLLRQHGGMDE